MMVLLKKANWERFRVKPHIRTDPLFVLTFPNILRSNKNQFAQRFTQIHSFTAERVDIITSSKDSQGSLCFDIHRLSKLYIVNSIITVGASYCFHYLLNYQRVR